MDEVLFSMNGSIAKIVLNRPAKLNALTPDMLNEIERRIDQVNETPDIRALVFLGEGRSFSVGADINIWSELSPEMFRLSWIRNGHRAMDAVARCRVPVIAALHGATFGGGLELALAADIRIAERGSVIGLPEASLGTVPGWGGTQRITELVGSARAKEMIFLAHRVSGEQAENWGLVNRTCEDGQATQLAMELAEQVAKQAPIAVQLSKCLIDAGGGDGTEMTLEMLGGMATQVTRDMQEGIAALRAKRTPTFTGD